MKITPSCTAKGFDPRKSYDARLVGVQMYTVVDDDTRICHVQRNTIAIGKGHIPCRTANLLNGGHFIQTQE